MWIQVLVGQQMCKWNFFADYFCSLSREASKEDVLKVQEKGESMKVIWKSRRVNQLGKINFPCNLKSPVELKGCVLFPDHIQLLGGQDRIDKELNFIRA